MPDSSSTSPCFASPGDSRARLWFYAAIAFVLVRSIPNVVYPIARDQATYLVIGHGLLEGQQLYLDLWDNKPPGIFYIFALVRLIFGAVMWCVGFLDILWLLAISYFIFRFARRYLGAPGAAIAVIFNASWHVWAGYWEALQTETFLILFVFIAYELAAGEGSRTRFRLIASGVAFGAAFWLKYNAILFLPFVLVLPFLDFSGLEREPRSVRLHLPFRQLAGRVTLFALGFAATVVVVLGQFWLASSWEALKEVQFEVLPRYSAMALERTPQYWLWALSQTEFVVGRPTEIATLVALVLAWRQRDLARFAPMLLGLAFGYLATASQARFHAYAFETCLPFFAMMWAYLVVKLYQGFRRLAQKCAECGWAVARALVWVLFANILAWPLPGEVVNIAEHYKVMPSWWKEREAFYSAYPWPNPISHFPDQMRVIAHLRQKLKPGDGVFVWGSEPLIYFLTERLPATRFVSNLAILSPWSPPAWRDELVRDLDRARPAYLIVARDDEVPYIAYHKLDSEEFLNVYPELAIFIEDHYEMERDLENFAIYRRWPTP